MLKIILNNSEIDLGSLNGITLKFNPGVFELNDFESSYSFPFTVPANVTNNKAFGFKHKINASDREIVEVKAELWHSGLLITEGLIKATQFSNIEYTCNFYIDNGELIKIFNSKNLNENWLGDTTVFLKKQQWNPNEDDYLIYPVYNPEYWKGTKLESIISEQTKLNYQNYYSEGELVTDIIYPNALTPFPLLWKLLKYLYKGYGYNFIDTFFDSTVNRNINIFNTNSSNTKDGLIWDTKRVNLANHVPDVNTAKFIKILQRFFNILFYVRNRNVKVIDRNDIIESTEFDDLSEKLINSYKKRIEPIEGTGISMENILTSGDLNLDGLESISDLKDVEIVSYDPFTISDPPLYKTVLYNDGNGMSYYRYINKLDIGLEVDEWVWGKWPYYGRTELNYNYAAIKGIVIGDAKIDLKPELSTLPDVLFTDLFPDIFTYHFPKTQRQGNTIYHKTKTNFGLILMFYQGWKSNVEGTSCPLGSYKNTSSEITSSWSYLNRWKNFIAWYNEAKKEVYEIQLNLTAAEIKNFDFLRKKKIYNSLFFITNLEVQLTRTEIKPVVCTLIKAI